MVNNKCAVPFCRTGYPETRQNNKDTGIRNPHLFSMPKDNEMFEVWKRKIKRGDKHKLTRKDKVCAVHFTEEWIDEFYETKMPDGSIERLKRGCVRLKKNAIPTIFPEYPSYLSKREPSKVRKSPKKRNVASPSERSIKRRKLKNNDELVQNQNVDSPTVGHVTSNDGNGSMEVSNVEEPSSLALDDNCSYERIISSLDSGIINIAEPWYYCVCKARDSIIFMELDDSYAIRKRFVILKNLDIQVFVGDVKITVGKSSIAKMDDIVEQLQHISAISQCPGPSTKRALNCCGFLLGKEKMCMHCAQVSRITKVREYANIELRKKYRDLRKTCLKLEKHKEEPVTEKGIDEIISSLPQSQQECVRACIEASKHPAGTHKANGVRYSRTWLYHAILLKIRSFRLYRHLRNHKILALPAPSTIHKYTRTLKSSFGFHPQVFSLLKERANGMEPHQRRGAILIDEMKLSPSVVFNKNQMQFIGFTDLGKYTPVGQSDKPGDHALVILYQPFQGQWVQSIGAFLSRGAATGDILCQILLEAIVLLENSNFNVDCVVCDGAQWNRGMWNRFGISSNKPYCQHVTDDSRKLYFISDFPHLMKNLWTWIISKGCIQTPDGLVMLICWVHLVKIEKPKPIKACPRLNVSHISPKQYEKMSVRKAYQFFSKDVAAAMQFYSTNGEHPELSVALCTPAIKFINRIARLIHAFSSATGKSAIRETCPEKDEIENFLEYLEQCSCLEGKEPLICSRSTLTGLRVSCLAALGLSDYLIKVHGWHYVMLSRMNQDNIEKYFGMIRALGGNNDHPDPQVFLLIFRLMSVYSLVKPEGSNVTGQELFDIFISDRGANENVNENVVKWKKVRDQITSTTLLSVGDIDCYFNDDSFDVDEPGDPNDSAKLTEDEELLQFFAGYVAFKAAKLKKCKDCVPFLYSTRTVDSDVDSQKSFIDMRNYFNVLCYPTKSLFSIVKMLEKSILNVITSAETLSPNTFFEIANSLLSLDVPHVGCIEHKEEVTGYIIQFYLVMRMHFASAEFNKTMVNRKKSAELRKMGKIVDGT